MKWESIAQANIKKLTSNAILCAKKDVQLKCSYLPVTFKLS